jgi:hypothetical protein
MRAIPIDAVTPGPRTGTPPLNEKQPPAQPALERHYSIGDVCRMWGLSDKTVKKIFADEAGVMRLGRPGSSSGIVA